MRALRLLVIGCTLAVTSAFAVDRDFDDIVRAISVEFGARPTRIPLFGLVNMVTFVARPAGTSHIDLAIFENLNWHERGGRSLPEVIRHAVGHGWAPFVQVHSRRPGQEETVVVYMRPEGKHCRLLVAAIERDEATVVQLKVNPDGIRRWISDPVMSAHSSRGNHGNRDIDEP